MEEVFEDCEMGLVRSAISGRFLDLGIRKGACNSRGYVLGPISMAY